MKREEEGRRRIGKGKLRKRKERALLCWLIVEELVTVGVGLRDPFELSIEEKFGGFPFFSYSSTFNHHQCHHSNPPCLSLLLSPHLSLSLRLTPLPLSLSLPPPSYCFLGNISGQCPYKD